MAKLQCINLRGAVAVAAGIAWGSLLNQAAQAAQTRSLVVSWFVMAANSTEGDCPGGRNPMPEDAFRLQLEHFQAKWASGSPLEMRPIKRLEHDHDSI